MKILKILETVKNFIKKNKKLVTVVSAMFCAVVLVAGSIAGTIAYLTDTAKVTNTFTVGDIQITLNEAKVDTDGKIINVNDRWADGNSYKLIPGKTYEKDPIVTVLANSEACYVFVKIENNISAIEDPSNTIAAQILANGWTALDTVPGVYYKTVSTSASDQPLNVFSTFKVSGTADVSTYSGKTIVITAYAIQSNGFADAAAAWTAGNQTKVNGGWN